MSSTSAEPTTAEPSWIEPPGVGRALGIGVAIGVVASFVAVGAVLLAAGQSLGAAVGMGAFVAIWGGLGFGGMVGGVVWASRLEAETAHGAATRSDGAAAPAPAAEQAA